MGTSGTGGVHVPPLYLFFKKLKKDKKYLYMGWYPYICMRYTTTSYTSSNRYPLPVAGVRHLVTKDQHSSDSGHQQQSLK